MGVFGTFLTKRFKNQEEFTEEQKALIKLSFEKTIPYMFKKLDRRVNMMNPDGTFLTRHVCPENGKNMPSIADIQLYNEFVDFKYLKYGELDHFKWQELYPRLNKWHLAMS